MVSYESLWPLVAKFVKMSENTMRAELVKNISKTVANGKQGEKDHHESTIKTPSITDRFTFNSPSRFLKKSVFKSKRSEMRSQEPFEIGGRRLAHYHRCTSCSAALQLAPFGRFHRNDALRFHFTQDRLRHPGSGCRALTELHLSVVHKTQ
jgi:hypothetical protein